MMPMIQSIVSALHGNSQPQTSTRTTRGLADYISSLLGAPGPAPAPQVQPHGDWETPGGVSFGQRGFWNNHHIVGPGPGNIDPSSEVSPGYDWNVVGLPDYTATSLPKAGSTGIDQPIFQNRAFDPKGSLIPTLPSVKAYKTTKV